MEAERTHLIMDVTTNRRKMQELEANLLQKLTTIQGSLVEDVSLIQVLNTTKATATEVKETFDAAFVLLVQFLLFDHTKTQNLLHILSNSSNHFRFVRFCFALNSG